MATKAFYILPHIHPFTNSFKRSSISKISKDLKDFFKLQYKSQKLTNMKKNLKIKFKVTKIKLFRSLHILNNVLILELTFSHVKQNRNRQTSDLNREYDFMVLKREVC